MAKQWRIDTDQNSQAYSYGSNKLSARRIFFERKKYDNYVFPDFLATNFVKTWTNDRFYGLVNTFGNSVYPNIRRLKSLQFIDDPTTNQYALDFVADAWYDFAKKVRELADNNIIYRDSPWAKPLVTKAWIPVQTEYDNYMRQEVYPVFYDNFMTFGSNNRKVIDVQSFLDRVDEYIERVVTKAGPITMSGLIEGAFAPAYISGLIIEISDDSYDDDFNKARRFGDQNFSFIAEIASQYGFSVDKNIPWRLVADLKNPAMLEYMLGVPIEDIEIPDNVEYLCDPFVGDVELPPMAYGFSQIPGLEDVVRHISVFPYRDNSGQEKLEPGYQRYKKQQGDMWVPSFNRQNTEEVFFTLYQNDFYESWLSDIEMLETYLIYFYNFYVTSRPNVLVKKASSLDYECELKTSSVERERISEEQFKAMYGDRWKLKTFYRTRKLERMDKLSARQKVYQLQQAMNIYNLTLQTNPDSAYTRALQAIQQDFIGPADTDPLTLNFVGDIVSS